MDNKDEASQKRERVLGIIDEIVKMASDGEYIYRGQPDVAYPHVSSTLYRAMENSYPEIIGINWLDMNRVQEEALEAARRYTGKNYSDEDMLSHIQHYSGDTNLIDFTTDYRVALFFACSQKGGEEGGKCGKVFLLKTSNLENSKIKIITPARPRNRVAAQKSVFVQPLTGIIPDDKMEFIVEISLDLKQSILDYLREYHEISEYSIYNDLHGYIRNRKAHDSAVMEVYWGIDYGDKGENTQLRKEENDALKKAIEHFNKAIRIAPDYADAYYNRGVAKDALGGTLDAISDYDKAIDLNPNFTMAYYNRGIIKEKLGDIDGAISDYNKAIEINPNFVKAYLNLGVIKERLGDEPSAINDYNKAIVLNPDYAEAYNNRGVAKQKLGDVLGAISDYNEAIARAPNGAPAYCNRGIVKRKLGDNGGAIKDFSIAIKLDPSFAQAYLNRGIVFTNLGNFRQALSDLEYAKKLALQQNRQDIADLAQEAIERVTADCQDK